MEYQKLYSLLFNTCTDALESINAQNFGQARAGMRGALHFQRDETLKKPRPLKAGAVRFAGTPFRMSRR